MTFLYEVCWLIPENIKIKSLLKTNYNKMRVSLGSCVESEYKWSACMCAFVKDRISVSTRKRRSKRCQLPHRLLLLHSMIWKQTYKTSMQFLVPMANLIILCFELNFAIFCGNIWVKNRLCTFKICSPERSDYSNINKITQSTKSIWNRATITAFHSHIFRIT